MGQEIHHYRRFKGYDYSQGASLFISMATEPRQNYFGEVKEAKVLLTPFGEQVMKSMEAIPCFNPDVTLYGHVLMPDHVHLRLYLPPNLNEPLIVLGNAMRKFKTYTTTLARKILGIPQLWQQGYHDRLCLSRRFIEEIERYIACNPLKYELLKNQAQTFHIVEPLNSVRLDPADYWRGMGNIALLSPEIPIASLRISRSMQNFHDVLTYVSRLVDDRVVILSGFVSPGEHAVRDMLVNNPKARIIQVLCDEMPWDFKPDSKFLIPLQEGRYLAMARVQSSSDFSREKCLEANEEMVEIAQTGAGMCLYFK